jgi:hypothetical protein
MMQKALKLVSPAVVELSHKDRKINDRKICVGGSRNTGLEEEEWKDFYGRAVQPCTFGLTTDISKHQPEQ